MTVAEQKMEVGARQSLSSAMPTFIIIGAMKGGTTSLYFYLAHHPDVSMSSIKETNYFLGRDEFERGPSWYQSLFDGTRRAIGEASPNYSKRHKWPGVAERIAQTLPDARLIYMVRDPIMRIVSHYVHNYAWGRENRPFSEVLTADVYVKPSMYAYQMDAFLDYFPQDQIYIVDSTALRCRPAATLSKIFEVIGVRNDIELPKVEKEYHISAHKRRRSALARKIKSRRVRHVLRPLLPSRLTTPQSFDRPVLTSDDTSRLEDLLRPDVERFRALTGMPFADWTL